MKPKSDKIECLKLSIYENFSPSIIAPLSEVLKGCFNEEYESLEEDDVLYITKVKMTQQEIDELPEFEGF
jgi:hypothetical protein